MLRNFLLLCLITLCGPHCVVICMNFNAEEHLNEEEGLIIKADESNRLNDIEGLIEKVEDLCAQAEKTVKEGILPVEDTEEIYTKAEEAVEELVDLTNETLNIYKFFNAKGIERVIKPNLGIHYAPLKRQLLLLIKNLFDVAPLTTNAIIPIEVVDKILDIFEYDDNLALKAHALDVLYVWLPDNPKVQTRVMKIKGLETFYNQVAKLDIGVIEQLLDLFNKILEEHIRARRKDKQRSKADHDKFIMYQRIGFIERLSMPKVCNGLLDILETSLYFNTDEKEISLPIFKLLKNIRPYCINIFKGKPKQTKLFNELLKYVNNSKRISYLEKLGLNVSDTHLIIKEYSNVFNEDFNKDEL